MWAEIGLGFDQAGEPWRQVSEAEGKEHVGEVVPSRGRVDGLVGDFVHGVLDVAGRSVTGQAERSGYGRCR